MAFLDHVTTSLNACSLEALPEPVVKYADGRRAWPLVIGCYELDEDSGERKGRLALHLVQHETSSSDSNKNQIRTPMSQLSLGEPALLLPAEQGGEEQFSGILDGKWSPKPTTPSDNDRDRRWWFATARASGKISLFEFSLTNDGEQITKANNIPCQLLQVGSSEFDQDDNALCLAVNWDTTSAAETQFSSNNCRSIVSTYSNGQVAVHDVTFSSERAQMQEKHRWNAHTLFGNTPTEVWTACFANNSFNRIVLSGGDDAKCKVWDLRCTTTRPIHTIASFDAGITVLSAHPRKDHLVAIGSYDESVAIYDVRSFSKPLSKASMGGGIWRIQWHPLQDDRLLVAAMHAGCRVVQLDFEDDDNQQVEVSSLRVTKEFTEHASMAYGADWLVCRHENGGYDEAAGSCSFYDRAAFLWDTVS